MIIVVSNNYLEDITVVAYGGGWNCKHKHAVGGSVDRDNRDSIQICINLNPGVNKFLDRYDKKYFTIDNARDFTQRENVALDFLRISWSSKGFRSSRRRRRRRRKSRSSSSSSSSSRKSRSIQWHVDQ